MDPATITDPCAVPLACLAPWEEPGDWDYNDYRPKLGEEWPYYGEPLLDCCVNGNFDGVVNLVEEENMDPNGPDGFIPALAVAALYGDIDIIEYLLNSGADINRKVEGYFTPIEAAVHENRLETLQYLLDRGASVDRIYEISDAICPSEETRPIRRAIVALLGAHLPAGAV